MIIPAIQGEHLHELSIEDDERGIATVRISETVTPASGDTVVEIVFTVTAPCVVRVLERTDGVER